MRWRNIVFMTGILVFLLSSPAASQEWVDIKNPKELRSLYSNKTFRSTYGGVPIVDHYRDDGKGISISGELRTPQTWEVKGNDQVCISDERMGTNCCRFQRSKKNPDEYVRRCTYENRMSIIKIEDGIPKF